MNLKAALGLAALLSANTANAQTMEYSDTMWSISVGANYRQNLMGDEVDRDMEEMNAGFRPFFEGFKPIGADNNFFNMTLTLKRDFPITEELGMRAVLWMAGFGGQGKRLYDKTYPLMVPNTSTRLGDARITFDSELIAYFNASLGAEFYYRPLGWLYVHAGVLAGFAYMQTHTSLRTALIADESTEELLSALGMPIDVNAITDSSNFGWSATLYAGLEFRFWDFGIYANAGYVFEDINLNNHTEVYYDYIATSDDFKNTTTLQQNWGPFAELGLTYYF